jgi:carbon storage regulator CsrA
MNGEEIGSLALSRKANETVIIKLEDGRTIEVTLAKIQNERVRLVFKAAKSINIIRKEVLCRSESKAESQEQP